MGDRPQKCDGSENLIQIQKRVSFQRHAFCNYIFNNVFCSLVKKKMNCFAFYCLFVFLFTRKRESLFLCIYINISVILNIRALIHFLTLTPNRNQIESEKMGGRKRGKYMKSNQNRTDRKVNYCHKCKLDFKKMAQKHITLHKMDIFCNVCGILFNRFVELEICVFEVHYAINKDRGDIKCKVYATISNPGLGNMFVQSTKKFWSKMILLLILILILMVVLMIMRMMMKTFFFFFLILLTTPKKVYYIKC